MSHLYLQDKKIPSPPTKTSPPPTIEDQRHNRDSDRNEHILNINRKTQTGSIPLHHRNRMKMKQKR